MKAELGMVWIRSENHQRYWKHLEHGQLRGRIDPVYHDQRTKGKKTGGVSLLYNRSITSFLTLPDHESSYSTPYLACQNGGEKCPAPLLACHKVHIMVSHTLMDMRTDWIAVPHAGLGFHS